MLRFINVVAIILWTGIGFSQTYTFKLKPTPKEIGVFTTHFYWGIEESNGKREIQYKAYKSPLYFKLFSDSTVLTFNTDFDIKNMNECYHYYTADSMVKRGKFKSDSLGNLEFLINDYPYQYNYKLSAVDVTIKPSKVNQDSIFFVVYKTVRSQEFVGKAKPFIIPPYSSVDKIDLYPVDMYYKIMELSLRNQELLNQLYPTLAKKNEETEKKN